MPDSHNVMRESRPYDALALDGVFGEIERYSPLLEGTPPSTARTEPFRRAGILIEEGGSTSRDLSADLAKSK
jgi:hypothetical protein